MKNRGLDSREKLAAAMAKFGKIDDDENLALSGPITPDLGIDKSKNCWKSQLVACGSNAFNQSHFQDIMSTSFKAVKFETKDEIDSVECGHTLSAARLKSGEGYIWGSGLPSGTIRIPTLIPMKSILKISCGQSHIGIITVDGKVYTWGSPTNGVLGYNSKVPVNSPKLVENLLHINAVDISCGANHSAVIGAEEGKISYVRVPSPKCIPSNNLSSQSSPNLNRNRESEQEYLVCGDLYTFGLSKTGQLGNPASTVKPFVPTPLLCAFFPENGLKVCRVSCGTHHTIALAVPVHAIRVFMTHTYTFGWGEHGRLGLGNEDNKSIPTLVEYPTSFHALDVNAGEQHTLVTGHQEAYAWGHNSFGQLGVSSPNNLEFSLVPMKLPLPEGMRIRKILAGGRHSAAITYCGRFLSWGWNEEGQLGHGTEKDAFLPRPCKIPSKIRGSSCSISDVSLGLCHTVAVFRNNNYSIQPPPAPSSPVKEEAEVAAVPPLSTLPEIEVVLAIEETTEPPLPDATTEQEQTVEPEMNHLDPSDSEPEPEPEPKPEPEIISSPKPNPIRGIMDILQAREERKLREELIQIEEQKVLSLPSSPEQPTEREVEEVNFVDQNTTDVVELQPPPPVNEESNTLQEPDPHLNPPPTAPSSKREEFVNIFYKDGQSLDNCLIANSARRAELRKLKKEKQAALSLSSTVNNITTSSTKNNKK